LRAEPQRFIFLPERGVCILARKKTKQNALQVTYQGTAEARARAGNIPVFCAFDKLMNPKDLVGNPRNPNQHPQEQIHLLAHIIQSQGWRAPITVSNQSGYVVRGHGRLAAALVFGAELTRRKACLTEIDPKYVDVIVNRYARVTGNVAGICVRDGKEIPYAVLLQEWETANGRGSELR